MIVTPAAGQRLTASGLSVMFPQGIIARAVRTTAFTTVGALAGVLRLDGVQLYGGRSYLFWTPRLRFGFATTTDRAVANLRVAIGGATATTATGSVGRAECGHLENHSLPVRYDPVADTVASIILTCTRYAGSSATTLNSTGDEQLEILVYDMGIAVSDTSVVL